MKISELIVKLEEIMKNKTKKIVLKKQKAVDDYIRQRHNQDECSGFIDGYERAENDFVTSSYYILALGMVMGGLIIACFM